MFQKEFEIREHNGAVFSLTHDDKFIYSASADKFVTRWSTANGKQDDFSVLCDSSIYKIFHLKFQKILIIGTSKGDIHIINTESKEEIKFIKFHKVSIFEIYCDEKNHRMYVGDADGNLSVWDILNWKLIICLPFDCGKIRTIISIEKSGLLLIGSQDGVIRVLDSTTFNLISSIKSHKGGCFSMLYSDLKQNVFFSAGKDGCIKVWNLIDFKEFFSIPAHYEAIYRISVYEHDLISVSRDKTIKVWDFKTLDFKQKIERKHGGHTHSVNDLLIIEDRFYTSGDDKRIISWIQSLN
jgi:WD40 repeat protein